MGYNYVTDIMGLSSFV